VYRHEVWVNATDLFHATAVMFASVTVLTC
jgi:hypothetical protein